MKRETREGRHTSITISIIILWGSSPIWNVLELLTLSLTTSHSHFSLSCSLIYPLLLLHSFALYFISQPGIFIHSFIHTPTHSRNLIFPSFSSYTHSLSLLPLSSLVHSVTHYQFVLSADRTLTSYIPRSLTPSLLPSSHGSVLFLPRSSPSFLFQFPPSPPSFHLSRSAWRISGSTTETCLLECENFEITVER